MSSIASIVGPFALNHLESQVRSMPHYCGVALIEDVSHETKSRFRVQGFRGVGDRADLWRWDQLRLRGGRTCDLFLHM